MQEAERSPPNKRNMKKYKIIYADPPWEYGNFSNIGSLYHKGRRSKFKITPYEAMKLKDLKELPISEISEKDSLLFMWVTYPSLREGLELMKSWGFDYKTVGFTWVKKNKKSDTWFFGLGNYTRANAEICLIGKRGKGLKVISRQVRQVCDARITKHSEKPKEIRDRIIQLVGDLPRIELFAREKFDGWDAWGNEIESDIELKSEVSK